VLGNSFSDLREPDDFQNWRAAPAGPHGRYQSLAMSGPDSWPCQACSDSVRRLVLQGDRVQLSGALRQLCA